MSSSWYLIDMRAFDLGAKNNCDQSFVRSLGGFLEVPGNSIGLHGKSTLIEHMHIWCTNLCVYISMVFPKTLARFARSHMCFYIFFNFHCLQYTLIEHRYSCIYISIAIYVYIHLWGTNLCVYISMVFPKTLARFARSHMCFYLFFNWHCLQYRLIQHRCLCIYIYGNLCIYTSMVYQSLCVYIYGFPQNDRSLRSLAHVFLPIIQLTLPSV